MGDAIVFQLDGDPVPWGRPIPVRRGKRTRLITPEATRDYEKRIGWAAWEAMQRTRAARLDGPVRVEILAVCALPLSDWRTRKPAQEQPRAKKPDVDNIAKAVLDGCNNIVWVDDAQVSDLRIRKVTAAQGKGPRVVVRVQGDTG